MTKLLRTTIPEEIIPIDDSLIEDKLLSERPELSEEQWIAISGLASTFAEQGPNKPSRHVRRKLAFYHMIQDAISTQERYSGEE